MSSRPLPRPHTPFLLQVLRATELRLAGNALATAGDLRGAVER
jgi:hypothetical protein